jgi:hypothetical protein
MPVKREPSFVIIAPKGEEYSSIDDETFALYQSRPWFMELTLEQYCAWVITADTVRCNSSKVFIPSQPDFEWDVEVTAKRMRGLGGAEPVLDFPGLAPGWFKARRNDYAWFTVPKSVQESYTYNYPPVGFKKGASAVFILNNLLKFEIEPFYHRDKFYLVWDFDPRPPQANRTLTIDISPTRLFFQTLDANVANTVITKYEFNLNT